MEIQHHYHWTCFPSVSTPDAISPHPSDRLTVQTFGGLCHCLCLIHSLDSPTLPRQRKGPRWPSTRGSSVLAVIWSATLNIQCLHRSPNIVAPLLSIGLFGFAWTSLGPPHVHWIAPMIFSALIAIANVRTNLALFSSEANQLCAISTPFTWLRSII